MTIRHRQTRSLSVIATAAVALAACTTTGESISTLQKQAQRPNIVLIVADDLGYSDIGAFGGEIATPHIDALAAGGRMLTNFHVATTCSPTRAMLMSGADHHKVGLGNMAEVIGRYITQNRPLSAPWGAAHRYTFKNLPEGYEGHLNARSLSMAELLRDSGYHTYMVGKWHLAYQVAAPDERERSFYRIKADALPHHRGFDRSFALVNGGASHYAPPSTPTPLDLVTYAEDARLLPATQLPKDFYSTAFFTDRLIEYIGSHRGDGKPFFAYAAYTAPHWPLHAPEADIAAQKGRYDAGYDAVRERRLERMKQLGLVAPSARAHPVMRSVAEGGTGPKRWHELTAEEKAREARLMEIYAAMVTNLDRHVGRLVAHLKKSGQYDNTLILFMSDNGAEGAPPYAQAMPGTSMDNALANLGRPGSVAAYGPRWAEVSSTPLRLFKGFTGAEGATSSPLIVKMPGPSRRLPLSDARTHVTDVLPTLLSAAGVPDPGNSYKGRAVHAIEGISLWSGLSSSGPLSVAALADRVLANETLGTGYVVRGPWKLSQTAPYSQQPTRRADIPWQLHDLRVDRAETTDLSATRPDVAAELRAEWERYVQRSGVVEQAQSYSGR